MTLESHDVATTLFYRSFWRGNKWKKHSFNEAVRRLL